MTIDQTADDALADVLTEAMLEYLESKSALYAAERGDEAVIRWHLNDVTHDPEIMSRVAVFAKCKARGVAPVRSLVEGRYGRLEEKLSVPTSHYTPEDRLRRSDGGRVFRDPVDELIEAMRRI